MVEEEPLAKGAKAQKWVNTKRDASHALIKKPLNPLWGGNVLVTVELAPLSNLVDH